MNNTSGGDGISVELLQFLKMMQWKFCTQYASKFGKLSSGHKTGKMSVFIPISKKDNAKESSNYRTIALISDASKVILKILQTSLPQYVNHELPDIHVRFIKKKKKEETDQIANICWIIVKPREFQKRKKNLLLLYWLCKSLWLCGSQQTVEKNKQMGIPDHLAYLLRNLYAGQEATVKTGTTDWFQSGKGVHHGYILSLFLFNLYADYIMRNAGMDQE